MQVLRNMLSGRLNRKNLIFYKKLHFFTSLLSVSFQNELPFQQEQS